MDTMSRKSVLFILSEASLLFDVLDEDCTGEVHKTQFVERLLSLPYIDVSAVEAGRMFDSLTTPACDSSTGTVCSTDPGPASVIASSKSLKEVDEARVLRLEMLEAGVTRWKWLRSMLKVFSAFQHSTFNVPTEYDYTKSTIDNYGVDHREFGGPYADIRSTRDYGWHRNVSLERQQWQDLAVKTCLGKTEAQSRPWVVYTCGPMGVGKGHVLNWLSAQQLFPLEFIVHVDPDFFKSIMPEWTSYRDMDEEQAGSFCHAESIYLQEIAMETALRQRQHVLVDGSLSNGEWFSSVFDDIRARFPHYRIAIVYITASEKVVRARIAERSLRTGRNVPESQIVRSLESPEKSISLLAPKTDLVVRIVNEDKIELKSVEDHSGNWHRGLHKHFGSIAYQRPPFPAWLGPIFMEHTSIVGDCLDDNSFRSQDAASLRTASFSRTDVPPVPPVQRGLQRQKKMKYDLGELDMEVKWSVDWKRRRVEIVDRQLIYYKSSGSKDSSSSSFSSTGSKVDKMKSDAPVPLGQVPINALTSVASRDDTHASHSQPLLKRLDSSDSVKSQKPRHFSVSGVKENGQPYVLQFLARTKDDRQAWMNAIQNEIDESKREVLHHGVLDKQGQFVASWKTRLFVLSPGKLSYYNSEDDRSLRGEVILTEKSTVSGINSKQGDLHSTGLLSGFLMDTSAMSFFIVITGVRSDGTEITMNCSTKSKSCQEKWIAVIQNEIDHCQKLLNMKQGFYVNSFEDLRLTRCAIKNSPNLQHLHKSIPALSLLATKLVRSNLDKAEEQEAVYLRWLFPGQELNFSLPHTKDINTKDPDVCLLRLGGLLEYDKSGTVRAVRAIVEHQTMHMVEFGEPERLMAQDADRLHAGERWRPVKSTTEAAAGALYMTFVLPYEDLPSRRFPKFGSFAYIFREPSQPEDPRDRYFPLLGDL